MVGGFRQAILLFETAQNLQQIIEPQWKRSLWSKICLDHHS